MKFSICLSILIQTETCVVLNNIVIILLDTPMIRGSLVQYFYSMNGRVQCHGQMNEKAKLQKKILSALYFIFWREGYHVKCDKCDE